MTNPFMTAGISSIATGSQVDLPVFAELDWDFNRNKFRLDRNGAPIRLERIPALKVWIRKALLCARYRYLAYFDDYGLDLEKFQGKVTNDEIESTELFRYVQDALLVNPYITAVANGGVEIDHKIITLTVNVTTIYGKSTLRLEV